MASLGDGDNPLSLSIPAAPQQDCAPTIATLSVQCPLVPEPHPSTCPQPWDWQGQRGMAGLRAGCCFFNQLQDLSSKGFVAFGLGAVLLCADPGLSLAARGLCRVGLGPRAGGQALLSPVWGVFPGSQAKQAHVRQRSHDEHGATGELPIPGSQTLPGRQSKHPLHKTKLKANFKNPPQNPKTFPTHAVPTAFLLLTLSPSPPPTPGAGSVGTDAMLA